MLIAFCLMGTCACLAQDRGTISGVVRDSSGATVPETPVTALSVAMGFHQSTRTGTDGTYTIPYLTAGVYAVTAEKSGFRTAQVSEVQVSVNTVTRVDIQLQVGDVRQTVDVAGIAPLLLQTDRADFGKVFSSKTISDLPLTLAGGIRSNLAFVMLTPGVTMTPGGDVNSDLTMRIGGGLASGHSMLLDGAEAGSERRYDPDFQAVLERCNRRVQSADRQLLS